MNAGKIPVVVLNEMAGFPVGNLLEERHEVTLLGTQFENAKSLNKEEFWKEYRRCLKKVSAIA